MARFLIAFAIVLMLTSLALSDSTGDSKVIGLAAMVVNAVAFFFAKRRRMAALPVNSEDEPVNATVLDVSPIIAFVGGERTSPDDQQAIELEVGRQLAAESGRVPNHASVALALCQDNGAVEVGLYRAGDPGEPEWVGVIGRVPASFLPNPPIWTLQAYRTAEPAVRAVAEAALGFR